MTTPTGTEPTRATPLRATMTKTTTRRTAPGVTVGRLPATATEILWRPVDQLVLGPVVRAVPAVGPVPVTAEIPAAPGTVRPGCPRSAPPVRAG